MVDYDYLDRAPALPEKKYQRVTIPFLTIFLIGVVTLTIWIIINNGHL